MAVREFPNSRVAVENLKRRMGEQRDQKRRQKLVSDLELIRNRRRHEIVHPIPPGHNQTAWFAKLRANGIWTLVFELISEPSDVTSAYFACKLFRKHVEKKRLMMSLQKVFGILHDERFLHYSSTCHRVRLTDELTLLNRDVLSQRLVSKVWKKAAEEELLVFPLGLGGDWNKEVKFQCSFTCETDVDLAMEAWGTGGTYASLLRSLIVNDEGLRLSERDSFYTKLLELMNIHGDSVWSLWFRFCQGWGVNGCNYEVLRNLVSKLPNLISLELGGAHSGCANARSNVLNMMVAKPFPTIPLLDRFECGLNSVMLTEVLRRNESITAVGAWYGWNLSLDPVWNALRRQRLTKLHLTFVGDGTQFLNAFVQLSQFDWPLKLLDIVHISPFDRNPVVNVGASQFCTVLNRFNESLEEVSVRADMTVGSRRAPRVGVADFSNLKKIDFPRML